jgi:hypothetical protein
MKPDIRKAVHDFLRGKVFEAHNEESDMEAGSSRWGSSMFAVGSVLSARRIRETRSESDASSSHSPTLNPCTPTLGFGDGV